MLSREFAGDLQLPGSRPVAWRYSSRRVGLCLEVDGLFGLPEEGCIVESSEMCQAGTVKV